MPEDDPIGHAGPPWTERSCRKLAAGQPFVGRQDLTYLPAVSAESVGAHALHMQIVTMPPGARAKAHKHEGHETAVHVLSGLSGTWYGERLEHHHVAGPGDFLYIPAGVPHLPYNMSATEPCVAVIARTDPNEQESVVLMPELDVIHAGDATPAEMRGTRTA